MNHFHNKPFVLICITWRDPSCYLKSENAKHINLLQLNFVHFTYELEREFPEKDNVNNREKENTVRSESSLLIL
jgi:hypothetical protein